MLSSNGKKFSRLEILAACGIFIAGTAITLFAFFSQQQRENENFQKKFNLDGSVRASIIVNELLEKSLYLAVTKNFFDGSEQVTKEEFEAFVDPMLDDSAIQGMRWAVKVDGEKRAEFEKELSKTAGRDTGITEIGKNMQLVKAGGRKAYYPVFYIVHGNSETELIGFDLFSEKSRRYEVELALKNRHGSVSGRIDLIGKKDRSGVLIVFPVFKKSIASEKSYSDGEVLGVVAAAIDMYELVNGALKNTPLMNLPTKILEVKPGNREEEIFSWEPRLNEKDLQKPISRAFLPPPPVYVRDFVFEGKNWRIKVIPGYIYIDANYKKAFFYILPVGIIITAFITMYIVMLIRRRHDAEKLAEKMSKKATEKTEEVNSYFNMALDLFCIANTDGFFLKLNPAWEATLGYSLGELEGKKFLDMVHPDDLQATLGAVKQLSEGKKIIDFTNRYRAKDGSYRWIEWRSAAPADKGIIYAAARDITERKNAAELVETSEKKFRAVIENLSEVITLIGPDGNIIYDSPSNKKVTGYTPEERMGKNAFELVHPDDRQRALEAFGTLMKTPGARIEIKLRNRHKNGEFRWLNIVAANMFNEPAVNAVVVNFSDITEKKTIEDALKEREFWLSESQSVSDTGSYSLDVAKGIWKSTDTLDRIFGLGTEYRRDVEGWANLIHPEDRESMVRYFQTLIMEKTFFDRQYRIIRKNDNQVRWVYGRGKLQFDEKGNVATMLGTIQDVTERVSADEKIRESEEKFRLLYTSMNQGMALHEVIFDKDGKPVDYRFLDLNDAYTKLVGFKKEETVGKTVKEVLPGVEQYWIDNFCKVAMTGEPLYYENYVEALKKHYSTYAYSPKKGQFAVLVSDITERKQQEAEKERFIAELEEKNVELERFVYTVSHDLKSPLVTIAGFAGLLKRHLGGGKTAEAQEDAEFINNAAKTMDALLADLLEISRIGRVVNKPEKAFFQDLVEAAEERVHGEAVKSGAVITISEELKNKDNEAAWITADIKRIIEALQNLISNAIKFSVKGRPVQIEFGVKKEYKGRKLAYYIKDDGAGIEPQYLNKIFGLFERLNPDIEGTGVGLAIVKRIFEVSGGEVWAESEGPGKGTAFYFTVGKGKTEAKT